MASISGVRAGNDGKVAGGRVALGVGGVEAVDVGEEEELVGLDHLGDPGGEAVIVAEADLGGGDAVILVDDGDAAEAEQVVRVARALR